MKLRKMKERRNIYRDEKDGLQQQLDESNSKSGQLLDQINQMQESSHDNRQENARLQHQLERAEGDMNQLQGEVTEFQDQVVTMRDSNKALERELMERLRNTEDKNKELIQQKLAEGESKDEIAQEVVNLERQVKKREQYVINLENEAVMLRDEIKNAKFNNEKGGYDKFVGGLTKLRASRDRSHPGASSSVRESQQSEDRQAQRQNYNRVK